ncbi:MAG TPA: glycoside hydrolase family 127 protein [Anaerohalosphaeraceae bacterium]|nr:glycoside hydrolase family 127 protein [Anaerohalosphaeraceae bacterium]
MKRTLPAQVPAVSLLWLLMSLSAVGFAAAPIAFEQFEYSGQDITSPAALEAGHYRNPILAGFHPDPSICRVGDDYYLINSTFQYFPGLPIFHSKDLVNWKQIGHVIHRPEQLNYTSRRTSGGLFAPAITYHKGLFYVICTMVDNLGNFVVTAQNPAGPWSNPVKLDFGGIDPSIFFDNDDRAWIVNNDAPQGPPQYDGHRAIWIQEFDWKNLKMVGPRKMLIDGGVDITKKPIWIEGPHIYKRKNWYYLCCAEGGTGPGHSQVIFRSRSVDGPYTPWEKNPILTQRDLDPQVLGAVTCTGHADLEIGPDGNWWAVFLAVRPYQRGLSPMGRETFLLPVTWTEDDWPTILPTDQRVPLIVKSPNGVSVQPSAVPYTGSFSWRDDFKQKDLSLEWIMLRQPKQTWWQIDTDAGRLLLTPQNEKLSGTGNPSFLGRRVRHPVYTASVTVEVPKENNVSAGLALFMNERHHYFFAVRRVGGKPRIFVECVKRGQTSELASVDPHAAQTVRLTIEADKAVCSFRYQIPGEERKTLLENADAAMISFSVPDALFLGATVGPHVRLDASPFPPPLAKGSTFQIQGNPIFRDAFTADPAPLADGDTLYVYVGHDEAKDGELFNMTGWLCYSTKDMKNWAAHGTVLKPTDFQWAVGDAWASQVIKKDGKYYFFATVQHGPPHVGKAVGVAVSDSPTGPFKDARGSALVYDKMTPNSKVPWEDIDPTVLIDDDGTPWLCWGNGDCYLVKLKPNLIELDGEIQKIDLPYYTEGPWLHKRGNLYYLTYAAFAHQGTAEKICYATAPAVTGPWTYQGILTGFAKNSYTIHPGIVEFKGQWYFFYHNATLTLNGLGPATGRRSVCVEYLYYNPDGTIQPITQTEEGISVPPKKESSVSSCFFPLKEVRLLPSPFSEAVRANREYLLAHKPDRLLAPYRREAGLEPKAAPYGNWESSGLDGHTAGHYLSALSLMIAAGADPDSEFGRRLDYMLEELAEIQKANGNGYIGGVPGSRPFWKGVSEGRIDLFRTKWVPWYNVHKMFAGLRDAYVHAGRSRALELLTGLGDWCESVVAGLNEQQMQQMLDTEHGGMNEVLADLYELTGNRKYLELAKQFNHRRIFEPLENRQDRLTGLHANTQIPKIVGMQRIAALTGDEKLHTGARFFWETVTRNRTVAFGGNSVSEHFNDPKDFSGMIAHREGPETCNTYNMLRLTEALFEAEPKAEYADYYERALYNHILASIHPRRPGYVYFTPIRPEHYRVYSQPEVCFWCCVGTGMENPGRYGRFIYTRAQDGLYVNLFIPSVLTAPDRGLVLKQETSFPDEPRTRFSLQLTKPADFTLYIRHPYWVKAGEFAVKVNGQRMDVSSVPSSYAALRREWKDGDTVEVDLPMHLHSERLPDGSDWAAILYGPIVLVRPAGTDRLDGLFADGSRMGHVAHGPMVPLDRVPVLLTTEEGLLKHIAEDRSAGPLHFRIKDIIEPPAPQGLLLMPFFRLHEQRYQMYWELTTAERVAARREKLAAQERARQAREEATLDWVAPGEQQPETEHDLQGEGLETGIHNGRRWRHGSWIQYTLDPRGAQEVILSVTYSGDDRGREFDILVNGTVIATQQLTGEKPNHFIEKRYPIPAEILRAAAGKRLTVRFAAKRWLAGGLYDVRLLRPGAPEIEPFQ